ncbi:alpha/beta hydrolase [Mycobacterium sp. pW049]|uniref:alpha/beta hydrolase n=1 Tax=[Mycobacterium] bulgaricum TaxID=3238985 RepID=UPI00351BE853
MTPEGSRVNEKRSGSEIGAARDVVIGGNGASLSGTFDAPDDPLAIVVALPGGGLTSRYFHGALHPSLSLLTLGRRLGYAMLALDRPGYGASKNIESSSTTLAGQAATIWDVLSASELVAPTTPVFLVGHSFGAMVALQMAGTVPEGLSLWGVDFSGIGTRLVEAVADGGATADMRALHWGPEYNYPEDTFVRANMPASRMPEAEPDEAMRWGERVAAVTAAVRCPVRITLADGEGNWANEPGELASLFVNAASVHLDTQARSGHNISLSWAARAYHLRVMAFFDDCVRAHRLLAD